MRKATAVVLLSAILLLASARPSVCEVKKVVATFLPVYISTVNVAGDKVDLSLLIPPGTDVHEFSLRPLDVKKLYTADMIMTNGVGLEGDMLKGVQLSGAVVDASAGIEPLTIGGVKDPHVWLDPLNVIRQVTNIMEALKRMDPENGEYYETMAGRYIERLNDLNGEIAEGLAKLVGKELITYHESFNYFARRYGLFPFSLTGPAAEQPLPQRVQAVYDIVKEKGIRAVFTEEQFPERTLDRLRRDLGIRICSLNTLESGVASPEYYETAMRKNLMSIVECLGAE